MAALAHINLLRISLVTQIALQLFSCKKLTHETINIDVVVMNDITQKPEPEEEVILVERKEKFTGLKGLSYEDNVLARRKSNANGVVHFGLWDLRKRKKFSYVAILQYNSNATSYQHVIDEIELDKSKINGKLILSSGPSINNFYVKPKVQIDYFSGNTFQIRAISEYRIRKNFVNMYDSTFYTPYLQSDFRQMRIKETPPMGTYFITLIKQKNGVMETIYDTIFCPRDQDYIYEFEF